MTPDASDPSVAATVQWHRHQRLLRQTRRQPGAKRVHALRVGTRRLLARLDLLQILDASPERRRARRRLRRLLRATGPARDAHIQSRLFAELTRHAADPGLRKFRRHLKARERRLTRDVARELRDHERSLRRLEAGRLFVLPAMSRLQWRQAVDGLVGRALRRVLDRQRSARFSVPENYHSWRVALKQFRYLLETLPATGPERAAGRRRLQAAQAAIGDLHDFDLLLGRWEKYAARPTPARALAAHRPALHRRRTALVRRLDRRRLSPAELRRLGAGPGH